MAQKLATHVAVIGGGCAGLAAACELARNHIPVTLYESSHHLGGRARGLDWKGTRLDNGQHIMLGAYQSTLNLLALTGVDSTKVLAKEPLQLVMQSDLHLKTPAWLPAPMHMLFGIVVAKGLSSKDRWRALQMMAYLRLKNFKLSQDMPLAAFLKDQKQTTKLIKQLWEPLCLAALNTPLASASTQVFLNVLRDSFTGSRNNSDLVFPKQDLSALITDPAMRYIEAHQGNILTGAAISNIRPLPDALEVDIDGQPAARYSHIIIATQPFRASSLLDALPECASLKDTIDHIDYQPIYTVYLQYPQQSRLPRIMTGMTTGLAQWVFDRGQLYGQHGLIAVIISAEGQHQKMTQEALAEEIANEMSKHFPELGQPLWHKVIAEKRATFSCRHDTARPSQRTPIKNLYLAGDYVAGDYPATIEGAVRSGFAAAKAILNS